MSSSSFQHFFLVLDEVESGDSFEQEERRLETIPEKSCMVSPPAQNKETILTWDNETGYSRCRARRYSLRRPGFVYRTKNFTRHSHLSSNLWELTTCKQRILKSPSFRYHKKWKSGVSPYATNILESLNDLSLTTKTTAPSVGPCHSKVPRTQLGSKDSAESKIRFLPLKKSDCGTSLRHCSFKRKHAKSVISPAKLSNFSARKTEKCITQGFNSEADDPTLVGFHTPDGTSTFCHLSAQSGPVDKGEHTCSFDNFRDPTKSEQNHEASTAVVPAWGNICIKDNSDNDSNEKYESRSDSPRRQIPGIERSCSFQARMFEQDMSVDELSIHLEDILFLPQKMSTMAEMMYT